MLALTIFRLSIHRTTCCPIIKPFKCFSHHLHSAKSSIQFDIQFHCMFFAPTHLQFSLQIFYELIFQTNAIGEINGIVDYFISYYITILLEIYAHAVSNGPNAAQQFFLCAMATLGFIKLMQAAHIIHY